VCVCVCVCACVCVCVCVCVSADVMQRPAHSGYSDQWSDQSTDAC